MYFVDLPRESDAEMINSDALLDIEAILRLPVARWITKLAVTASQSLQEKPDEKDKLDICAVSCAGGKRRRVRGSVWQRESARSRSRARCLDHEDSRSDRSGG
jgi:hypothetical protein